MIPIVLSDAEVNYCQLIGMMRCLVAKGHHVVEQKRGPGNTYEIDVLGFMAELAFAKHFNLFYDLGLSPRSGSADGILHGYRYDIKSTEYESGKLIATTKVNPDVDMYVLCVVSPPCVDIRGYAFKRELIDEANLTSLGYGECYALEQSQLRQFKSQVTRTRLTA